MQQRLQIIRIIPKQGTFGIFCCKPRQKGKRRRKKREAKVKIQSTVGCNSQLLFFFRTLAFALRALVPAPALAYLGVEIRGLLLRQGKKQLLRCISRQVKVPVQTTGKSNNNKNEKLIKCVMKSKWEQQLCFSVAYAKKNNCD